LEKDGASYIASFPDLPNVQTIGDTRQEALSDTADALNGSFASDVARGIFPPAPSCKGKESRLVFPLLLSLLNHFALTSFN
jgi:predicted RNase H-like HicB family nuclease